MRGENCNKISPWAFSSWDWTNPCSSAFPHMLCAPVLRPAWWPFTGLAPVFQHISLSGEPKTVHYNTLVKWSTGMPNRVNKPSPWCAYNILTSPVSTSHHCHKTASLTHGQVFVLQNPLVLFLLSSQLVSSLCCCRWLFSCRDLPLPVLNFTRFHKVSPSHWGSSGPYSLL